MNRLLFFLVLMGAVPLGACACTRGTDRVPDHVRILRASDHTQVSFEEMLDDLKKVNLVFVGEQHDRQSHHLIQLKVIRALHEAAVPVSVGLEMFREQDQAYLDLWTSGRLDTEDFQRHYYQNWDLPWSLYGPIFLFARENRIPMIGLNIPREITRQVAREGFTSLKPEQLGPLTRVSCQVDATYEEFIRRALGAHGHSSMSFTHFCEAQMLWDTAMACNLMDFLKNNPRTTVVVLAGIGHAWKRGIPAQIRRRSSVSYRVILPEMPDPLDRGGATLEDADFLWIEATPSCIHLDKLQGAGQKPTASRCGRDENPRTGPHYAWWTPRLVAVNP